VVINPSITSLLKAASNPFHKKKFPTNQLARMKKMCLVLLALLFMPACSLTPYVLQTESVPSDKQCWQQTPIRFGVTQASMTPVLNQNIDAYKTLVERSLVHREIAIRVMNQLKQEGKINGKVPLSGADLDMLNAGLMDHLSLRENLYEVAYAQSCWFKASEKTYQQLKMEPISEANQLKGTMLSLSAALILYDNYLMMSSLFEESRKLRRFLNQKDPAYAKGRNELKKLAKSYNSEVKRKLIKRVIKFYELRLEEAPSELTQDENFAYLNTLIRQSQSYNMARNSSGLERIGKRLTFMNTVTQDDVLELKNEGINLFSGLFGNTMGLVESRKGKLHGDAKAFSNLRSHLQAGDILLEKTPFRLTDKLIPGFWGHAAIWIGTETELRELGIWENPAVVPYHQKIRTGHSVVEALRPGVQMNSLQHFLNVDDVAALRSPSASREVRANRILLALKQVGKDYDFNFDVETTDKIVCSELVYTVYTDIPWPTEKALGRYTISPDNVAKKALSDGSLNLVSLYHDGKEVTADRLGLLAQLMGEPRTKLHGWNQVKPDKR
jgi:hypothetical protein